MEPSTSTGDNGNAYAAVMSIESVKSTTINIHIVPYHWIDGQIMYYPPDILGKSVIEGMIQAGAFAVAPNKKKWKKFAFILKKKFRSFDLANIYINKHQSDDTDDTDDANLKQLVRLQTIVNSKRKKIAPEPSIDFNGLMGNSAKKKGIRSTQNIAANNSTTIKLHIQPVEKDADGGVQLRVNEGSEPFSSNNSVIGDENEEINIGLMSQAMDLPVLDFDDHLKKIEARFDEKFELFKTDFTKKFEAIVKKEFQKTAELLEGVVKKHGGSSSSSLIPITAPNAGEGTSESDNYNALEREILDKLNTKITSVEDIEKLEENLLKPEVVGQYIQYYQSVLMSPESSDPDVRATTIILQMTNRLFDKQLLPNKFTWAGRSPFGPRIAFKKFENIIKLIHAVSLHFVPAITLANIEQLLYKKVLKHSKARALSSNVRESTGRKFCKARTNKKGQKPNESNESADGDKSENASEPPKTDTENGSDSEGSEGEIGGKFVKVNSSKRVLSTEDEDSDDQCLTIRKNKLQK